MRARRRDPPPVTTATVPDPTTPSEPADKPSKTRLKQQMHELQALGERLVKLSEERLADLPLTEGLRDAVVAARAVRSHEGRRRQMQYVGRLMRSADATAIREALSGDDHDHQRTVGIHHAAEHWRDGLVAGRLQLDGWRQRFPADDDEAAKAYATLERLVDAARRDQAAGRTDPTHARQLYRALHRWLAAQQATPREDAVP